MRAGQGFAAHEAIARDQDGGPEHLLLGLLREAEEPIGTDLPAQSLRERVLLGLPDHGPHPIKLLVEGQALTLGELQAAVLERGAYRQGAAGPSRSTPRTRSSESASGGSSTSHQVAPAAA